VCGLANRMQLKHVTYLSVFRVEEFPDVPHFASKLAVENALREFGLPFTTLRPSYYMQNDLSLERLLTGPGVYPIPIGTAGISAVDIRDIGRGGRDHAYRKRPRRENSRPGWPNARRWTWCCGFVEQTAWEKRCTAGTTLTALGAGDAFARPCLDGLRLSHDVPSVFRFAASLQPPARCRA